MKVCIKVCVSVCEGVFKGVCESVFGVKQRATIKFFRILLLIPMFFFFSATQKDAKEESNAN